MKKVAMPLKAKGVSLDVDRLIGVRLREIRKVRGMSQAFLGELAQITSQQVQKYETGANRLSVATLIVFCKGLEINPVEFIGSCFDDDVTTANSTLQLIHRLADTETRLKAICALTKITSCE